MAYKRVQEASELSSIEGKDRELMQMGKPLYGNR
jgi:hypothetical protein